jgi:hypothetical protein
MKTRWMMRGELTIEFLRTWKAAGIPPSDFFHPGPVRIPNGRWTR